MSIRRCVVLNFSPSVWQLYNIRLAPPSELAVAAVSDLRFRTTSQQITSGQASIREESEHNSTKLAVRQISSFTWCVHHTNDPDTNPDTECDVQDKQAAFKADPSSQVSSVVVMALSVRAKNFIMGGSLATFASAVFGYTFYQMSRDDFKDLDTVKVQVHQSGIKPSTIGKHDE